jgi:hypothetical protein
MSGSVVHCYGVVHAAHGFAVDTGGRVLVRYAQPPRTTVMFGGTPHALLTEIQEKTLWFSMLCRDILQSFPPRILLILHEEDRRVLSDYWADGRPVSGWTGLRVHKDCTEV